MMGQYSKYSVNCDFADRNAISKLQAVRFEQRREASQNQATSSGRFLDFARNDVPVMGFEIAC